MLDEVLVQVITKKNTNTCTHNKELFYTIVLLINTISMCKHKFNFVLRIKSELKRNYKQKNTVILYSYLPKSLTVCIRDVSDCSVFLYGQTEMNANSIFIYLVSLKYFLSLFYPHLVLFSGFKEL